MNFAGWLRALVRGRSSGAALRRASTAALSGALVLLTGCVVRGCPSSRPPIHLNPSMDIQPKAMPQSASDFFYDGATMRQPVPGTVAIGELRDDPAFYEGKDAEGKFVASIPLAADEALLARGQDRYNIYCAPCHDMRGDGKGILFTRGSVPTASFHDDKVRNYPDGQLYDVITNGSGLMAGYRWPIAPHDRWAIVAYVRQLQSRRSASDAGAAAAP